MNTLLKNIIPTISIVWCLSAIIDQFLGDILGLSFIKEEWASMTIITSSLFIILFSTRLISRPKTNEILFVVLAILSILVFLLGLQFDDRTYLSSLATSILFLILSIHGYFFEREIKVFLRFVLKFIVYTTSILVLIVYFLAPDVLYSTSGFESVSWNTAVGFLLYSSTLLSSYYGILLKKSALPDDFSLINRQFVDFWFKISFFFPVFIILVISLLHFFGVFSTNIGMALGLFFVCLLPFPITYIIYRETVSWSYRIYNKNKKLFLRDQDVHYHNELLQEFAQITSHNLRGPIIGLSNLAKLIADDDLSEDVRTRSFELMKEKLPSLVTTIDSLADFYNMIKTGEIEYQTCDIEATFQEAYTDSKHNFDFETSDFSYELNLFSKTIEYPDIYLKNLFYNLVSNSFKYRKKTEPLKITLTTKDLGNKGIEFTYKDNGIGMDLTYFKKNIFKFGKSYHNFSYSTGMGLFIVKNQLSRLGDTIDVNSEEGKYTEFIIRLNHNGKKELGYS